ncbi:hypothetical protein FH972_008817 [Carpinus fangiana]|uniref:Uncharacterized protein n=1 Tax=Carpinus fangiana TaxID=176857 RepID=A0A5N6R2M4_9ROSI|nr:hypothetical protein FH972_008817 [Carpinus fangiana]
MGTTLLLSSAFSPLSHRPRHGNERTHLQPQTLPPQFAISFLFQLPPEVSAGPPHSPWALTRRARPLRVGSVGEDSAAFELGEQKISSWMYFSVVLGVVLFLLDLAWIDNSTGLGKAFIEAVSELSDRRQPRGNA